MFSKPIIFVAASIASTKARILAQTATAQVDGTDFSDAIGCGKCLGFSDSFWIQAGQKSGWATLASAGGILRTSNTLTSGGVCCKDSTTDETGATQAYCASVFSDTFSSLTAATVNTKIKHTTNDYFMVSLAQCPHHTDSCKVTGKKIYGDADYATDLVFADERYLALKTGESVQLELILQTSTFAGSAPNLKQKIGDVCTWLIMAECDAPVLTVPTGSNALAANPEWEIQVLEYTEEFLQDDGASASGLQQVLSPTWTKEQMSGALRDHYEYNATSKANDIFKSVEKKWYPPLGTDLSSVITDLIPGATEVAARTPNNLYGDIYFARMKDAATYADSAIYNYFAFSIGDYYTLSGNAIQLYIEWYESIIKDYTDNTLANYNTSNDAWTKYASYETPHPTFWNWFFSPWTGKVVDPDQPKVETKTRQPTQPIDVPYTLQRFNTYGMKGAQYKGKAGYGYPSTYMLTKPIQKRSGKAFGTLAGKSLAKDNLDDWTTVDSTYSIRKSTNYVNYDLKTPADVCDKSYLMITGVLNVAPSTTAMTVKLNVTSTAWSKTLKERIPTRPDAVSVQIDGPKVSPYADPANGRKLTFIGGLTAAGMLITTSGLL